MPLSNVMSKHVGLFVTLELLVLGGGPMRCPNVGVKFKNQYLSRWTLKHPQQPFEGHSIKEFTVNDT